MITLGDLNLDADTYAIAAELVSECPYVRFTSGRRTVADQARAMAENTLRRRDWIALTYTPSKGSKALIAWVGANPGAKTMNALVSGFIPILSRLGPDDLAALSRHLAGRAFDVQPEDGASGEKICSVLRQKALTHGGKFLEREGGLTRWHFQL